MSEAREKSEKVVAREVMVVVVVAERRIRAYQSKGQGVGDAVSSEKGTR